MKTKGLLVHIVLTCILIVVLFWKLIPNLNHVYFSRDGDGFRTYFGMYYHAKFDSTYHKLGGMNYPFGEMIDFTDCQPPVSNFIRFISISIVDISDYTTGINNGLMLISILLASIFLFLILKKLKLPDWYSSVVAICMVFLSPQIQRMGGHFSLSWMLWVPLSIYLLMLFDKKQSYWLSILIGFSSFFSGAMHFYFLAFWIFLFAPYWLYRWTLRNDYQFKWSDLYHIFIQIILPLLILEINLKLNDIVSDRTANPWGFYAYRGHFMAVFLPLFKSYVPFLGNLGFAKRFDWEAFSYIGLVASSGFFVLIFRWGKNIFKNHKIESVTENKMLDYLLGISFLVLLFSFGLPFILGLDKLRQFIGPLGQLRGVARFGWLFFFVINIVVFHQIYFKLFAKKGEIWKRGLTVILLAIFAFEAWAYSGKVQNSFNNKIPDLEVNEKPLFSDQLLSKITPSNFQAILPLPYFHIGSESSWIESECDIMKLSFIVSMKTGLPNIGMMGARTSISQTYKNIELVKTPWEKYRVLDEYRSNKPLLLVVAKCNELDPDEKRLVNNASFIATTANFDLYEMAIDTLRAIPAKYNFPLRYENLIDSIEKHIVAGKTDCFINSTGNIKPVNNKPNGIKLTDGFQRIMEATVNLNQSKKVYLRFWVKNYAIDLVARTQLLIVQSNPEQQTLDEKYSDIFRHIKSFNGEWALVEIPLETKQPNEIIKLLIKNQGLEGKELYFDEFTVSQIEL